VRRRRVIFGNHVRWGRRLRLDPRVLDWLRSKGVGRLTCIDDILLNLMAAKRRAGSGEMVQSQV